MTRPRGVRVRPYRPGDEAALYEIFYRAVHEGTGLFYDARERAAWAPDEAPGPDWAERLNRQITLVAAHGRRPRGFMALGHDGHLDFAYVAPEAMGRGVGDLLHAHLLREAQARGMAVLDTGASHLARRFLLRHGWRQVARQSVPRQGVALTNFRMELVLTG